MSSTADRVGFVANQNCGRGTISLLLQCFSTIVLCVYTSLHLNVPRKTLGFWASLRRKSIAIVVCVLAPELFTLFAIRQRLDAKRLTTLVKTGTGISISLTQAHFLQAGGIQLMINDLPATSYDTLAYIDGPCHISKIETGFCRQFWDLILSNLPSDAEINDRSKSSPIAKVITCSQAGKTLVLVLGRLAMRFDISLLEVATVAYIAVTLLSYVFWFSKSYDVETYQTLTWQIELSDKDYDYIKYERLGLVEIFSLDPYPLAKDGPDWNIEYRRLTVNSIVLILLSSIFAAIHCAAWRYAFPSQAEAILWRVSCVLIAGLPWIISLVHVINNYRHWYLTVPTVLRAAPPVSAICYGIARLILIIEIFLSLRAAPRGIYEQPNWAPYLGHDGA